MPDRPIFDDDDEALFSDDPLADRWEVDQDDFGLIGVCVCPLCGAASLDEEPALVPVRCQ